MTVIERTKKWEVPLLYALYVTAFPAGERKPFGRILAMEKEGRADLWTIRRNGRFAGFAATVNGPSLVLLDYFAVRRSFRGQGVGRAAMKLLNESYHDRGFFLEIESTFEDAQNLHQRRRRKEFYIGCGLEAMGTEADVFGVRMELLGVRCHLDIGDYRAFYRDHYSPRVAEHVREVCK